MDLCVFWNGLIKIHKKYNPRTSHSTFVVMSWILRRKIVSDKHLTETLRAYIFIGRWNFVPTTKRHAGHIEIFVTAVTRNFVTRNMFNMTLFRQTATSAELYLLRQILYHFIGVVFCQYSEFSRQCDVEHIYMFDVTLLMRRCSLWYIFGIPNHNLFFITKVRRDT